MAETVTTLDLAPEMVAIARDRVGAGNVRFEVADIFLWETAARFDATFFAAWLSHVPMSRFGEFWRLLAAGGRVLFIGQHVEGRYEETCLPGSDEIAERQLQDGSRYRIIKNFSHGGRSPMFVWLLSAPDRSDRAIGLPGSWGGPIR